MAKRRLTQFPARTVARSDLDEVARKHGQALHAFARRLTQNPTEAADLVHDALERALRGTPTNGPEELLRWTIAVIRNLFIDRCRRHRAATAALRTLRTATDPVALHGFEQAPAPHWAELDWRDVSEAAAELDAPFREVFRLHATNVPLTQMASTLQIPIATAGTRLFRARKKLRIRLTELCERRAAGSAAEPPGSAAEPVARRSQSARAACGGPVTPPANKTQEGV